MSHRLWENEPPTLGKSVTDFGEISYRPWAKTGSVLGKDWLDLGEVGLVFGLAWNKAQVSVF